jgi:hypothetical protein
MFSCSEVKEGFYRCEQSSKLKQFRHIMFNDTTCRDFLKQQYNANTITTFQGSREPVVVFHIDSKAVSSQLINRTQWIYTAVTRATDKLVVTGDVDYIGTYFNVNKTMIPVYQIYSGNSLLADCHVDKTIEFENEDDPTVLITSSSDDLTKIAPGLDAAVTIITDAIKPTNEASNTHYYTTTDITKVESGQLKIDISDLSDPVKLFTGFQIAPDHAIIKNQVSNSSYETIRTLVKRYSKMMPKMSARKTDITTDKLMCGFIKAIYGENGTVSKLEKQMFITPENLRKHYEEYIISLQKKIAIKTKNHDRNDIDILETNAKNVIKDINTEMNWYDETLSFLNKRQGKYDPKIDFDTSDKVGQGVAAMSKRVNLMLCSYSRLLNSRVNHLLKINNSPVKFVTLGSDEDFLDVVQHDLQSTNLEGNKWIENDFSEWDSRYFTPFTNLIHRLLVMMGCPDYLNDFFYQYRKHWKMTYRQGKNPPRTLIGEQKQFSGNPFTLIENSICNCSLIFTLFKFDNLKLMYIKGDDSGANAKDCQLTSEGKDVLDVSKHTLKMNSGSVCEFASFIITDECAGPDILRRASKFVGAVYRDEKHFNEAKVATLSCAKLIKKQSVLRHIAQAAAIRYNNDKIPITPEQIITLHDFLANTIPNMSFKTLTKINKPQLRYWGD